MDKGACEVSTMFRSPGWNFFVALCYNFFGKDYRAGKSELIWQLSGHGGCASLEVFAYLSPYVLICWKERRGDKELATHPPFPLTFGY